MPKPSANPYTVWVFDCPVCGGRTDIGDQEPYSDEDCADCGESIWMGSPDWDGDEETDDD